MPLRTAIRLRQLRAVRQSGDPHAGRRRQAEEAPGVQAERLRCFDLGVDPVAAGWQRPQDRAIREVDLHAALVDLDRTAAAQVGRRRRRRLAVDPDLEARLDLVDADSVAVHPGRDRGVDRDAVGIFVGFLPRLDLERFVGRAQQGELAGRLEVVAQRVDRHEVRITVASATAGSARAASPASARRRRSRWHAALAWRSCRTRPRGPSRIRCTSLRRAGR